MKIQGEILHSTCNPASYKLILYTELILQEIQGSFCAGLLQQLPPVYPSILHGRIKSPNTLQCSRPLQHEEASSNSTRQKQHSTRQPAYTQPFQQTPRRILQGIHLVSTKFTGKVQVLHCIVILRSVCSNLLLLALRIILQENTRKLILSRYLVILCEEITYYLTSKHS